MSNRIKVGDLFSSEYEDQVKYFQFVGIDEEQLNSDVIAVFQGSFTTTDTVAAIQNLPIDFYTHTTVAAGVNDYWRKIGSAESRGYEKAVFKIADHDHEEEFQEAYDGMTDHWQIWIGKNEAKYVGAYSNVPSHAELGLVFSPDSVYHRIFKGEYDFTNGYYGVNR